MSLQKPNAYAIVGYLGFIAIVIALAISEVSDLHARIRDTLGANTSRKLFAIVDEAGDQIRRYISAQP